jgi:deoxyribonuclease (pyrimidine dimer)|tara:strand:- start:627 stop:1061 length:435 start_codon:yes stop_codon:yes gene_type:complete
MTRINLVSPAELADQHLVAEYREIFMVGPALQRSLKSPNWSKTKETLPKEFTLNGGHVKFFYNKGKYLHNRYLELIAEMKSRGMTPDPARTFKREQWPDELYNDWVPTNKDLEIIRERITQRINQKPDWYRWTKSNRQSTFISV